MHALSSFPSLAAAAVSSHAAVVMGWGVCRVLVQGLVTSQDSDVSGRGNQGRGGGRLTRAGSKPRFRCEWLCTCQAPEKGRWASQTQMRVPLAVQADVRAFVIG